MQHLITRPTSPNDILERPRNGIVLVIASGSRAGEMLGLDETEWSVGFDADCVLRFAAEDFPTGQAKIKCMRTQQGWSITRVQGDAVFVNQSQLDERMPLRSGDIIRLGPRGPDFQFNLQSSSFSVRSLVARSATAQTLPNSQKPDPPSAPSLPAETSQVSVPSVHVDSQPTAVGNPKAWKWFSNWIAILVGSLLIIGLIVLIVALT